jgi:hypothetical protein
VRASRGQRAAAKDAQGTLTLLGVVRRRRSPVRRQTVKENTAALVRVRSVRLAVGVSLSLSRSGVRRTLLHGLVPHRVAALLAGFSSEPQPTTRRQESRWCARSCCDWYNKVSVFQLCTLSGTVLRFFFWCV